MPSKSTSPKPSLLHPQAITIFSLVTFISALLLFAVQPMIGKYLLPYFGGSAQLWSVVVLFFQTLLFGGYVYAHLLNRFKFSTQKIIHVVLVSALFLIQIFWTQGWLAPILPPVETFDYLLGSRLSLLALLAMSVGSLYFVLSTTGLLLQIWYSQATGKEPYWIYKISNIASLTAVFSYPFLIEPFLSVVSQAQIWVIAFAVYLVLLFVLARLLPTRSTKPNQAQEKLTPRKVLEWLALSAMGVFIFLSITNHLTVNITPTPFLWLVPLGMYLLSFVWAFNQKLPYAKSLSIFFFTCLMIIMVFYILRYSSITHNLITLAQVIVYCLIVLLSTTVLHHLMYLRRVGEGALSWFFVILSLGGMLGGVFVSLVAPVIFSTYFEVHIAVGFMAFLFAYWQLSQPESSPAFFNKFSAGIISISGVLALLIYIQLFPPDKETSVVLSTRNLYGVVQVLDTPAFRVVTHNSIIHGIEVFDPELPRANTYFSESSGLGRVMNWVRSEANQGLRVGVIGLGTGTVSAYCQTGDEFVYYEIDREMVEIAYEQFTYLDRCEDIQVLLGDARMVLVGQSRAETNFDVLVADAFTGNSVPIHLLTKEAVEVYLDRITDQGVVAIHISNQYFNLHQPLASIANELGLNAVRIYDELTTNLSEPPYNSLSDWVILTQNQELFETLLETEGATDLTTTKYDIIWTDSYSSLLPVLRW